MYKFNNHFLFSVVIPKSIDESRIAANANLNFEIPKDKMELLDKLKNVVKFAWDPEVVV